MQAVSPGRSRSHRDLWALYGIADSGQTVSYQAVVACRERSGDDLAPKHSALHVEDSDR